MLSHFNSALMSKTDNFVFTALLIIAWIIFVGLGIEAGGLIVNFFFSLYEPDFIGKLYQKLNLIGLYRESRLAFFSVYSFILSIAILKAWLFYILIMLMHRMDLSRPFNSHVSAQISKISYYTLLIGVTGLIAGLVSNNLIHHGYNIEGVQQYWSDSQAFILMGAIVYVIAVIFKKGVELQNDNDLTV